MRSLYEYTQEMVKLADSMEAVGMSEEEKQKAVDAWLESAEPLDTKLANYCRVVRMYGQSAGMKREEARILEDMARREERHHTILKQRLAAFLDAMDRSSYMAGPFTIRVQGAGGVRALNVDSTKVPERFFNRTVTMDYDLWGEVLEELHGAHRSDLVEAMRSCAVATVDNKKVRDAMVTEGVPGAELAPQGRVLIINGG